MEGRDRSGLPRPAHWNLPALKRRCRAARVRSFARETFLSVLVSEKEVPTKHMEIYIPKVRPELAMKTTPQVQSKNLPETRHFPFKKPSVTVSRSGSSSSDFVCNGAHLVVVSLSDFSGYFAFGYNLELFVSSSPKRIVCRDKREKRNECQAFAWNVKNVADASEAHQTNPQPLHPAVIKKVQRFGFLIGDLVQRITVARVSNDDKIKNLCGIVKNKIIVLGKVT